MIAQKLKYYRAINGLTQIEFANFCGVSARVISTIEARDSDCYLSSAIKIANALNVRIEQLLSPLTDIEKIKFKEASRAMTEKKCKRISQKLISGSL